jgi:PAS domain S-box-containing protein
MVLVMDKEINCINFRGLLAYLRNHYGDEGVRKATLGLTENPDFLIVNRKDPARQIPVTLDHLMDSSNWVSNEFSLRFMANVKEVIGGPSPLFTAGEGATLENFSKTIFFLARILGPRLISRRVAVLNAFFNKTKTVEVTELTDHSAVFRLTYSPGFRVTKDICEWNRGIYSGIAKLSGAMDVQTRETTCRVDGADFCTMEVTWKKVGRLQQIYRRLLKAGLEDLITDYEKALKDREQLIVDLTESEKRYRSLTDYSLTGIFIYQEGRFVYVNEMLAKLSGYTLPEFLEHPLEDMIHEDYRKTINDLGLLLVKGKQLTARREFQGRQKDGSTIWLEVLVSAISFRGSPALMGNVIDITEWKRAEAELKSSYSLLSASLESTADGILIVDRSGTVKQWNQKFADLWKIPDHIVQSRDDGQAINHVLDQLSHPEQFLAKVQELYNHPKESSFDLIDFKDGRVFERYSQPQRIGEDIQGRVWSFRDITERRRAEKEKRELEERLQRAEKMEALGTLAGGVAHDLNNVLGVMVGFSELLLHDLDPKSPLKSGLENILTGSQRAAAIVQDLLTLARRGVSVRKVLNLNKIVEACQDSPEFKNLSAHHAMVRIKTDLEPDLLNTAGSAVHLTKALFNLLSNASEAMPKGGSLTIMTANQYLDRPVKGYDEVREGDYVLLSVSDTGEGISPADQKRIFEPFYTKKVMGRSGTGLGLAVVWGTIKDHQGYINVQSEEGKGSTFTLYFPVTREEISKSEEAVALSEYMGKGESILVVDDIKGQRDLAEEMLKKLNYRVTTLSSGEEALDYLKSHQVDLLVLDMIMDPGMDGLATYEKILQIHPLQKAIIVSGFTESSRVNSAQNLGAGGYVKKPYVIEKLGMAVRKELDLPTGTRTENQPRKD